jgi:Ca-activated chloride channel homolog
MIGDFHFLRPMWLIALAPAALIVWLIHQRQNTGLRWRKLIAPQLLAHLLTGDGERSRFGPVQLLAVCWCVAIIALAGPAWVRAPAPFAEDIGTLAIVIKVSPTMMSEDIQPSRLARSVEKIHDLLERRRGAKTSLIAYAGDAHVVMPVTLDAGIIDTFAQSLKPGVMPDDGDGDACADALRLADRTLQGAGSGSILWITDSITQDQAEALAAWRKQSRTPVRLYAPLTQGPELDAVEQQAKAARATIVNLTANNDDIEEMLHAAKFSTASMGGMGDHWKDSGYWLTPFLALLTLPFFRRGWMAATAARQ